MGTDGKSHTEESQFVKTEYFNIFGPGKKKVAALKPHGGGKEKKSSYGVMG